MQDNISVSQTERIGGKSAIKHWLSLDKWRLVSDKTWFQGHSHYSLCSGNPFTIIIVKFRNALIFYRELENLKFFKEISKEVTAFRKFFNFKFFSAAKIAYLSQFSVEIIIRIRKRSRKRERERFRYNLH